MEEVQTGLPDPGFGVMTPYPLSWVTRAGSMIFTAHIPIKEDGELEVGDIKAQSRQTFRNLRKAVEAAGGTMADVVQVIVYLTDIKDADPMTEVWVEFFKPPYPNRAALGITALFDPRLKIEIVATAVLEAGK
jgi:enamine deaminase RidA (YjgF/YER057c/UK114 family)